MKIRKWIILSLILVLTVIMSGCDGCQDWPDLASKVNLDFDVQEHKYKDLEKIDIDLPFDNKKMIQSIIEKNNSDYRKEVPAYFNTSIINESIAKLKGVTYLEYLMGNRYTMDELEHAQKIIKLGEYVYYRVFLLNNTYLLYSEYSSKQKISDWWFNTSYNIFYNVLPETSSFEDGYYIKDDNGNYDMLVEIDELASEFYLSDTTTYICSHIWRNHPNLKFNKYEGALYLPSHDNPYYAFIEPIDKTLLEYKIHKDAKVVADFAFGECSNVEKIVFEDNNTCISIGDCAFYGCENLKSCNFPSSLKEISSDLFYYIPNIEKYHTSNASYLGNEENNHLILHSVDEEISDFTFEDDTKIIYSGAFNSCDNINKIIIPDRITYICRGAFASMKSLTELELGTGVKRIGEGAFTFNKNLKNITIKSHKVTYEKDVFDNYLENLYFDGTTNDWLENKFINCIFPSINNIKLYSKEDNKYDLMDNIEILKDVPSYAFTNYKHLNSIKLGNEVLVIGRNSFCNSSITKVSLGSNLQLVEKDAFAYCENIQSTIYQGIIDDYCKIVYQSPYSNPCVYSLNLLLENNGRLIKPNEIVIGDSVSVINDYAFYNVRNINKVTIGKNVKKIGCCAFAGGNIKEFYILSQVEMIYARAFRSRVSTTIYFSSDNVSSNYEKTWDASVSEVIWNYK